MMNIKRTDSSDEDFKRLVKNLDAYLQIVDGDEHSFYDQFNQIDAIRFVVVVYCNDEAVGCGAIKAFSDGTMEIKRMFVAPAFRRQGVAALILNELELWSKELGNYYCVLETGHKQFAAVALYTNSGYTRTANFGPYKGVENSLCFIKKL